MQDRKIERGEPRGTGECSSTSGFVMRGCKLEERRGATQPGGQQAGSGGKQVGQGELGSASSFSLAGGNSQRELRVAVRWRKGRRRDPEAGEAIAASSTARLGGLGQRGLGMALVGGATGATSLHRELAKRRTLRRRGNQQASFDL
jgi:hypothetical protein